jgi:hypothetical protein
VAFSLNIEIVGSLLAAATYLLEKREYLTAVPGKSYFLTAVKHTALRRLRYGWHRFTVFMDPEDAEAMMAGGMTSQHTPVA